MTKKNIKIKTSFVLFLILLITSDFYKLNVIPEFFTKFSHMALSLSIFVTAMFYLYLYRKEKSSILNEWNFVLIFLIIVLSSCINAMLFNDQNLILSFRITYPWLEYAFIYILVVKKTRPGNIYNAVCIFVFIRLLLYYYSLIANDYIFMTVVSENDLEGARGVMRIRVPGVMITYFWGFWSLGKYIKSKRKIYMLFFLISLLQSILEVSRQHIIAYFVLSMLLLLYNSSLIKKCILVGSIFMVYNFVLPHIRIYQMLMDYTELQKEKTDDFRENVRVGGAIYYIKDFHQSAYTILMGNGRAHSESTYGIRMERIMYNLGYILADIGFVGIYIYFGIVGILFYLYLLYWTFKQKESLEYKGIQYFVFFLYLTNIISNAFISSTLILPVSLYLLHNSFNKKIYSLSEVVK